MTAAVASNSPRVRIARQLFKSPRTWFALGVLLLVIIAATFAPWLAPTSPSALDVSLRLKPPSPEAWLGRDSSGGDVLTGMLYGARTSLYVAFTSVLLSVAFGSFVGLVSGFFRGTVDLILMRFTDVFMAFPGILLAIAIASVMEPSMNNLVLAISATGWTGFARLMRGQTLTLVERDYVVAGQAIGCSPLRLMFRHILPGALPFLIVHSTFTVSGVIIAESSLSFLGLGAQGDSPSWGALLAQGKDVLEQAPFLAIVPGVAILFVILALNFLGDELRDALDPRLK